MCIRDSILGAYSVASYGFVGTIHQPTIFSGGVLPTVSEIGTADSPVELLNDFNNVHAQPDADDLPNDAILSTAWTNNNSVTVQERV